MNRALTQTIVTIIFKSLSSISCTGDSKRKCALKIAAALLAASAASLALFVGDAEAGPFVQAGAFLHDGEFDEMKSSGNLDFPVVLELTAGYQWNNGWFFRAQHFSNPEAADTGLNLIGGGYRYEW